MIMSSESTHNLLLVPILFFNAVLLPVAKFIDLVIALRILWSQLNILSALK